MRYLVYPLLSFGLLLQFSPAPSFAQSGAARGALVGGASGAIIGGAVGRGRGAAIGAGVGAVTGAIVGDQMQRRRANFYWHNNQCWQRSRNNEFFRVSNRYCR
jgi:uncharacterized protein YcfJ